MEIVDIEGNNVISSRAVVEENIVKTTEMIEDACDAVLEGKIRNKSCNKESVRIVRENRCVTRNKYC